MIFGLLFICFAVTALIIRQWLLYIPAALILICEILHIDYLSKCLCLQFPWIGNYILSLKENEKSRFARILVCSSMLLLLLVMTFLFMALCRFLVLAFYPESYPEGITNYYFGSIVIVEILSLLHCRSRLSLILMPLFVCTSYLVLLYYLRFNVYPFHFLAIFFVLVLNCCFIIGLAIFVERKLLFFDESNHFVPSSNKPRQIFLSIFSTSWIEDSPPIWTLFMDYESRSRFKNR